MGGAELGSVGALTNKSFKNVQERTLVGLELFDWVNERFVYFMIAQCKVCVSEVQCDEHRH